MLLTISDDVKEVYSEAKVGILVIKNVRNLKTNAAFNQIKNSVKEELMHRYKNYSRKEFIKSNPVCHYISYYKSFKKTYPVLLQLESVILKSKPLPNVSTLIEAMFLAELKNMLLTGGHDLDKIEGKLTLKLSAGGESSIGISGHEQLQIPNDMMICDNLGVISSIINGPDQRTRITQNTKNAVFCIYVPYGVSKNTVINHLQDIANYIFVFSNDARIELLDVL